MEGVGDDALVGAEGRGNGGDVGRALDHQPQESEVERIEGAQIPVLGEN